MTRPLSRALLVTTLLAAGRAAGGAAQASSSARGVDMELNVRIPLRDGVHLNATLYRPRDVPGRLPVILAMTPYIADRYHAYVLPAARRGYIVAVVDVRGRGSSDGEFEPFSQEAKDGYDTIEWIAAQPWCNGKVGMMGGSYGGFNQWSIVKEFPPHLATIAPTASSHMGIDFLGEGAVIGSYLIQWISFTSGRAPNANLFGDGGYWADKFRQMYMKHLPFAKLDSIVGNPSRVYRTWVEHPGYDSYWSSMAPSPEQLAKLSIPIFTRTGMYDGDQVGAMEHYRNHMKYGSADAKAKHYLMIGPWDHAGTRVPLKRFGGLTFGDASLIEMGSLEADWYDWVMKGGPQPKLLPKRVAYYVTGEEVWKYADSLSELGRNPQPYYLTSTGRGAKDLFQSGSLSATEPAATAPDEWTYDPLDTEPGSHEGDAPEGGDTPTYVDQSEALNLGGRGVIYHTAPLDRATEITGFPKLTLWVTLNVPDTDFKIGLYEITADGRSILLDDCMLRARYRESRSREALVTPGVPTKIEFTRFRFMSRRLGKGSRVRLLIQSPNSIFLEKNYNSGGAVAWETAKDARTAEIKLHHEAGRWSLLELPVVGR
ncbi:MAG: CocE/NonD family hydrolase [Gemmatimonadota bacterium]